MGLKDWAEANKKGGSAQVAKAEEQKKKNAERSAKNKSALAASTQELKDTTSASNAELASGMRKIKDDFKAQIKADTTQMAADKAESAEARAIQAEGALFVGESHDDGRNATVTLWPDRIERTQQKQLFSMSGAHQDAEMTPIRTVSSVRAEKDGMLWTKVTVFASGNNIEFRFGHAEADRFKQLIQQQMLAGPEAPPAVAAAPDIADQIKKLADLHAAGILTDDEFATKKTDLLDRM